MNFPFVLISYCIINNIQLLQFIVSLKTGTMKDTNKQYIKAYSLLFTYMYGSSIEKKTIDSLLSFTFIQIIGR